MFKNILILLFFLCICGLSCSQNFVEFGDDGANVSQEDGSKQNNMMRISKNIIKFVLKVIEVVLKDVLRIPDEMIKEVLKLIGSALKGGSNICGKMMDNAKSMVMDTIGYLSSSNDTDMANAQASMSPEEFANYKRTNGGSIGSKMSKLFMKPFKMVFGSIRSIPAKRILDRTRRMLAKPIGMVMKNPMVQTMANRTMRMADSVANQCWGFTKKHVLPRVDTMIKRLKDSDTLPPSIMAYLNDLQSLYHVLKVVGVA